MRKRGTKNGRGALDELDYYEVVQHSRSGINGAQSEGSHLPRNRDNNYLPIYLPACLPPASVSVRVSTLSPCNKHSPPRISKPMRNIPRRLCPTTRIDPRVPCFVSHLKFSIPFDETRDATPIVKLLGRRRRAVNLEQTIYHT